MVSALIVVDMLNDFMDGVLANPAAGSIVAPIQALIERARSNDGWMVVYGNDAHRPGDVELKVFPPHAMEKTPGAAVIDDLKPAVDDLVVGKRYYSAFTETELAEVLAAHGVNHVVLVGQHTDCCIRHTSYDAFRRGLDLTVCPDATTVFEPGSAESVADRQQRALEYLRNYYGAHLELSTALVR